jgi:hypothetical protein
MPCTGLTLLGYSVENNSVLILLLIRSCTVGCQRIPGSAAKSQAGS